MVDRLKTQLGQIDTKLRRMRQERTSLIARKRAAEAQSAVASAALQLGDVNVEGEFARMGRRVRHSEAVAAASVELYSDTLSGRLDAFEDERVEAQLLALKGRTSPGIDVLSDPLLIALEESGDHQRR
jgi:phage shock protein A